MITIKRFTIQPVHLWIGFLLIVLGAGAAAYGTVMVKGLSVTNLTDLVPWGLWITIDLSAIALSAGAFTLCAVVYLLGLKQYEPVARTATFIGLIGYTMALLTLLLDIGRPDRFWHAIVYWNTHSLLWEVSMCLTLYLCVLALETAPLIGRTEWMQNRFPWIANKMTSIHRFAPILAIFGLGLSMLHQSSLGATYGVLLARPIWYKPGLSVMFMFSAIVGGPALTVLVTKISGRLTPRAKVDDSLLEKITLFIGWGLVGYIYFRFWDAFSMTYTYEPGRSESLSMLTSGPLAFNFLIGEMLLGALIPAILLLVPRFRKSWSAQVIALMLIVAGVVAFRWDVNMSGLLVVLTYLPQEINTIYTTYFPSIIEIISGLGVVAYGVLAVTIGVRYLNLIDHPSRGEEVIEKPVAVAATD
ncbi:MAG: NrfD/PsrC family molybdoenzyme membrane anchor subunit [Anaerolineales bacterium]|nr:polysulfide reductase NrfD [Anaerolineales bacterium]HUV27662.1 NrfD/PsrC family molybdoenzyme membrane anchor subunit [Anaerolineales bacterium]